MKYVIWRDIAPFRSISTLSDGPYSPYIFYQEKRGSILENTTALSSYDMMLSAVFFRVSENFADSMSYAKDLN